LRLRQALEMLSPQQRQCLFLRCEGLRYREIAEVLEISVGTVSEFLRRAINHLRRSGI
jgi:RNA polymerase sigma-70 factor (ECF subfamily)